MIKKPNDCHNKRAYFVMLKRPHLIWLVKKVVDMVVPPKGAHPPQQECVLVVLAQRQSTDLQNSTSKALPEAACRKVKTTSFLGQYFAFIQIPVCRICRERPIFLEGSM